MSNDAQIALLEMQKTQSDSDKLINVPFMDGAPKVNSITVS
jgi:hypothetical protein